MLFLERQTFENHWFATGTPSFLIKLLRQREIPAYYLEKLSGDNILLDRTDVNDLNPFSLLFQTGYLTVKQSHPSLRGQKYELGYPNYEVAYTFQQYLLADYLDMNVSQVSNTLLTSLEQTLNNQMVDQFINILNSLFAGIPHTLFLPKEAYYHSLVYLVLKLLGFNILAEPLTSQGRIDAVIELSDIIYIIEFKMSTAQVALDQIKDRGYDRSYHNHNKAIVLLDIAFDKEQRAISGWQSELVQG